VIVQQTSELLKIHREGLSPQARSEFQAGLAAYQSNKQEFQALLTAFLDVLHLDEDYWQNLAEYETAIARLEQLTGLSLHEEGANQ
jgi:cobalt-zinc-cadmium efflux system outer membrane protein